MTMQKQTTIVRQPQCLGCQDCKGLCRAVIELAVVPDTVLNRATAA